MVVTKRHSQPVNSACLDSDGRRDAEKTIGVSLSLPNFRELTRRRAGTVRTIDAMRCDTLSRRRASSPRRRREASFAIARAYRRVAPRAEGHRAPGILRF